jgi:hypothetical protein
VVEQLLGERLADRVVEVARCLDAVDRSGQEPDGAGELVEVRGLEHVVDERVREVLVLGAVEHDEVAAAREGGVLAARACRLEHGPDLALQAGLGLDDRVVGPAPADQHGDVAVDERRLGVGLLPPDGRLRGQALLVEVGVELDRLGRLRRVQLRRPRVAVLLGDLAARLPDRRQVHVLGQAGVAGRVDTGDLRLDRLGRREQLVPRLGGLHAGLLQHVLAIDQRARAGVPGLAPDLAVERRRVDQARDVLAAGRLGDLLEGALVGELGRPRRAHLGDVGRLAARDRRRELVVRLRPGDELDVDRRAGVLGLERRPIPLDHTLDLRGARIHDPDVDRARQLRRRRRARLVSLAAVAVAAATGGERHAHDGQRREQHLWSPHFSSSSLAARGQRDI